MPITAVLPLCGRAELPWVAFHHDRVYLHALRAVATITDSVVVVLPERRLRATQALTTRREVASAAPGAVVVDEENWFADLVGADLLIHDPLCPLTPVEFLRELCDTSLATERVRPTVACRPVTDTVKTMVEGRIVGTLDRERLVVVTAPVLVPGRLVTAEDPPPLADFAVLADWLRRRCSQEELAMVRSPSMGRRVDSASAVHLLECVDEVGQRLRS